MLSRSVSRLVAAFLVPVLALPFGAASCGGGATSSGEQASTLPGGPTIPSYPPNSLTATGSGPIRIPIETGVSRNGQATLAIPFDVPLAARDMQPSLGLSYTASGNGKVGANMMVTGLSAIAPCRQTFASHGLPDGVDYDRTDAYCLDGDLIVQQQFDGNGGLVYGTSSETFQKIEIEQSADDQQPTKFLIWDRNGVKRTYLPIMGARIELTNSSGNSTGEAKQVAIAYPVATIEDPSGNAMRFTYQVNTDTGGGPSESSYRIGMIEYSFASGFSSPYRRVEFQYDSRPDPIVLRKNGVTLVDRSRLVKVHMFAPNPTMTEEVWRYELGYATSAESQRSLLAEVKKCADVCSASKKLSWSAADAGPKVTTAATADFDAHSLSRSTQEWLNLDMFEHLLFTPPTDVRMLVFDADGDGDDDVLFRSRPTYMDYGFKLDGTSYNGYHSEAEWTHHRGRLELRYGDASAPLATKQDVTAALEPTVDFGDKWIVHLGKSRVGDIAGSDGRADLLLARTKIMGDLWTDPDELPSDPPGIPDPMLNFGKWTYGYTTREWPWLANPSHDYLSFTSAVMRGFYHDYYIDTPVVKVRLFDPAWQRGLVDLDGDGRIDQVDAIENAKATFHYDIDWDNWGSVDNPFFYRVHNARTGQMLPLQQHWSCGNSALLSGDFDGDGRGDLLATRDDFIPEWYLAWAGAYSLQTLDDNGITADREDYGSLWGGDCSGHVPDLVMADFNGDGLEDALYPPNSYMANTLNPKPLVRWNTGRGFGPLTEMLVKAHGVEDAALTDLMYQSVPKDKANRSVAWDRGTRVVDLNGDGRDDIVAYRITSSGCVNSYYACSSIGQKIIAYLSVGDHFEAEVIADIPQGDFTLAHGLTLSQVGDVTGDGAPDLVMVVDGKVTVRELRWRKQPDLLVGVDDSSIPHPLDLWSYDRKWWGDDARPAPQACTYPQTCSTRGMTVVREHDNFVGTRETGATMYNRTIHAYYDPRSDLMGYGFLGFGSHRAWNVTTGAETWTSYDHHTVVDLNDNPGGWFYPYASSPVWTRTIVPLRDLPTSAVMTASNPTPGLTPGTAVPVRVTETWRTYTNDARADGRAIFVKLTDVTTEERETGAFVELTGDVPSYGAMQPGGLFRKRHDTLVYDDFGNVTSEVVSTDGGVSHKTTTAYEQRPASWMLSLMTKKTTRDLGFASAPPRIEKVTYNPVGLPSKVEIATAPADGVCGAPPGGDCDSTLRTTTYDYNTDGVVDQLTVQAADDPTPRTTHLYYGPESIYVDMTQNAAGHFETQLHHPALGVVILAVDPNGATTKSVFDHFGRIRKVDDPTTADQLTTYDEWISGQRRGSVTTTTRAGGSNKITTDELGRPIRTASLDVGGQWDTDGAEYNWIGAVEREVGPGVGAPNASAATEKTYDRLGRLASSKLPGAANASIITAGTIRTEVRDPEGHVSYQLVDVDDRVVETATMVSGSAYGKVQFVYDAFDQVAKQIDANGNATIFVHDAYGRIAERHDPDVGLVKTSYNGFDEIVMLETPEASTASVHDVLGRVTSHTTNDGVYTYAYDSGPHAKGRLVSASSPDDIDRTATYDTLGRLAELTTSIDSTSYTVHNTYDPQGKLEFVQYPDAPGRPRFAIRNFYNARGQLDSVHDVSTCPAASPGPYADGCNGTTLWQINTRGVDGRWTEGTLGNTRKLRRQFDAKTGWVTDLEVVSMPLWLNYGYNGDGQVRRRTDMHDGRTEKYSYDPLHRLTRWDFYRKSTPVPREANPDTFPLPSPLTTTYRYDALGNLRSATGIQPFDATYGAQRPHGMDSSNLDGSFTYDSNGRQLTGGDNAFTYTAFDLPRQITSSIGLTKFRYDDSDRRVLRVRDDNETISIGGLYERRTAGSQVTHVFNVLGNDGPVAQVHFLEWCGTNQRFYPVVDRLGSVAGILDDAGGFTERHYYEPFGQRVDVDAALVTSADPVITEGFTGHEHDEELGLVNMKGRIYNPRQRRFVTPDPMIADPYFGQAYNPYSYVLNDPVNLVDSTGLQEVDPPGRDMSQPPPEPTPDEVVLPQDLICAPEPNATFAEPEKKKPAGSTDHRSAPAPAPAPAPPPPPAPSFLGMTFDPRYDIFEPEEARPGDTATDHTLRIVFNTETVVANTASRLLWSVGELAQAANDVVPLDALHGTGTVEAVGETLELTGGLIRVPTFIRNSIGSKAPITASDFRPGLYARTVAWIKAAGRRGLPDLAPETVAELGHLPGSEAKPLAEYAIELGMNRGQLTRYLNSRPQFFVMQSEHTNAGHAWDIGYLLEEIKADMRLFMQYEASRTPVTP